MKTFLLVVWFSGFVFGQIRFEASGQTEVFTFKAGAKAAWDHPISVTQHPDVAFRNKITLSVSRIAGIIVFRAEGMQPGTKAKITIYTMNGKIADILQVNSSYTTGLRKRLLVGIYFAKLETGNKTLSTTSFLVMR